MSRPAEVNELELGATWYTRGRRPERAARLLRVFVGGVPKGRRRYVFVDVESPPGSGLVTRQKAEDFVNRWWRP